MELINDIYIVIQSVVHLVVQKIQMTIGIIALKFSLKPKNKRKLVCL